jgi:hypothetical protein
MNVKEIVGRFGGQSALAALIGKGQSTVAYWVKAGNIPAKWQSVLLSLAREQGVGLSASDFHDEPQSEVRRPEATFPGAGAPAGASSSFSFMFYGSDNENVKVQVMLYDETVWASQRGMSEIFGVEVPTINYHLREIFTSGELKEVSVVRKLLITAADGKNYDTNFYNLDAIISVGYRVNSYQATQFRKWATTVLRSYLIKGFALDDDRLKQGKQLFGKDYFDELLERIREIRASERRFYQKITDIYAQCSIDYDRHSPLAQQFYAHVQDKLHYAIHGKTSAELIRERADASKLNMGLQSYKNSKNGGKITRQDVTVGKNYLNEAELDSLNRLVSMYLDFAENFARRQIPMKMSDWSEKLDSFLRFNAYDVLENFGQTRRDAAEQRALAEFEKYRVVQDEKFVSDFDKIVDEVKAKKKLPKH